MLPLYDTQTTVRSAPARALVDAIRRADALLVSSPGYHGTMSGMVKNALDYVEDLRTSERPYLDNVPVGCIAVASGWQASVSTLHSLRVVAHALRAWPTPLGVAVNGAGPGVFDSETGECLDVAIRGQLETVASQAFDFAALMCARRVHV